MVYTDLTRLAMQVAYKAHHGQSDRQGVPYVFHPIHLAEQMDTEDECVVALLHDVVEDTDITFEELEGYGFTGKQIEAIKLLTHIVPDDITTEAEKEQDYYDYVEKIRDNPLAKKVKLADLAHNSDRTRLKKESLSSKDEKRFMKYERAKEMLNDE